MEVEKQDLEKIDRALQYALTHHRHRDEMNAAVHMNEKVIYSNLTNELERAVIRLERYLHPVETNADGQ